jgi:hypothetical protein
VDEDELFSDEDAVDMHALAPGARVLCRYAGDGLW